MKDQSLCGMQSSVLGVLCVQYGARVQRVLVFSGRGRLVDDVVVEVVVRETLGCFGASSRAGGEGSRVFTDGGLEGRKTSRTHAPTLQMCTAV